MYKRQGEAYKCHTFWDTEMFLFSAWLYTEPEVARRLLRYRYLTLPKAKEKAAQYGCEGALFPWESAWITDGEVTPSEGAPDVVTGKPIPIYTGTQEIHVNADIAYAVHRYFEATDDTAFMEECGYEMILETALYWASRAEWNEEKKQYEIHGVIGPDEDVYKRQGYCQRKAERRKTQNVVWQRTELLFYLPGFRERTAHSGGV